MEYLMKNSKQDKLIFTIKPTFEVLTCDFFNLCGATFIITIFLTVFSGIFWGSRDLGIFFTFIFIYYLIIKLFLEFYRKDYEKTKYEFYSNRVECIKTFFGNKRSILKYKEIVQSSLTNSFLQKKYNLGTIIFLTRTGASENSDENKFLIENIKNSKKIYEEVQKLIE